MLAASSGGNEVSVTRYPLVKAYDPANFAAVAKELDRVAAQLAEKGGGRVAARTTTTVDGRDVRAYRLRVNGVPTRIGFVLVGKVEYQLKCTGDLGPPCELLFSSFSSA